MDQSADNWLHEEANFAWSYDLVNIHSCMMLDALHQLLKGVSVHLFNWVKDLSSATMLDERIKKVPGYQDLKVFPKGFTHLHQITGVEQKALLRQLVPVVAPLLDDKPLAMICVRAIVDLITITQFPLQTDTTLRYLKHNLTLIDISKEAFRGVKKNHHFNFPKWHSLVHIPDLLRQYGCSKGTSTCHFESQHRHLVKNFFSRTNRRENATMQLLEHNTRHTKTVVVEDEAREKKLTGKSAEGPTSLNMVTTTEAIPLSKMGWHQEENLQYVQTLKEYGFGLKNFLTVSAVATRLGIPEFTGAVRSFVAASRRANRASNRATDQLNDDDIRSWIVKLHGSVKCSAPDLESYADGPRRAYCRANWQKSGEWRRDCVWLRESCGAPPTMVQGRPEFLQGKTIGRTHLILSVLDLQLLRETGAHTYYSCVFVERFQPIDGGRSDGVHGLIEISSLEGASRGRPQRYQAYGIDAVIQPVHIISTEQEGRFYINHYVDIDHYIELHDTEHMLNGVKKVHKIIAELEERDKSID